MSEYSEDMLFTAERVYRRAVQNRQLIKENHMLAKLALVKLENHPNKDDKLLEAIEYMKMAIEEMEKGIQ